MTENPHLTFILGGARSGKSAYAESLIMAHPGPWFYIATAQAFDDEMRERINIHQARRGGDWRTIEAPQLLPEAVIDAPANAPLMIDCLAIWLSNRMFAETDLVADRKALVAALLSRNAPTVVVSPEVGLSIVPENALARAFRDAAGVLHQEVAKIAAHVALVVAGYPVKVK
ncbi:bifunctional adenosylcobinamide kinase/adenosylcobinamide-phosphate guanylyltransferase [Methylocystis parvus]|uniref:Bifunctional adenosylcobalamin biosynthesis protein n=1 Tax=Methylocystis parvus TaxID=134 RepID=A0A6B8M6H8_9HYPH|nr:bifunctional adenosylcobinamide kinase/adenosylcobinamide-phosphate guanylyltransferase [Methylocystis parvus]QGM96430.1 bifunctional adenosylcobinamide kinase/adenosylcobinamide-phosphate guanylyltransferase [Methylocystis parvus]WBJ99723.1 bifunctional adenosylcobinamide kinase/adenosylcobinamide-phosphate guanylyltransferase [Methylocystis parvus OBBP]